MKFKIPLELHQYYLGGGNTLIKSTGDEKCPACLDHGFFVTQEDRLGNTCCCEQGKEIEKRLLEAKEIDNLRIIKSWQLGL